MAAEDWTNALAAVLAPEAGDALAVAKQTFTLSTATVRAIVRHIFGYHGDKRHLLGVSVVVVQREEPMTRLHIVRHLFLDRRLQGIDRISETPSINLLVQYLSLQFYVFTSKGKKEKKKEEDLQKIDRVPRTTSRCSIRDQMMNKKNRKLIFDSLVKEQPHSPVPRRIGGTAVVLRSRE